MTEQFKELLQASTAPMVLISGTGIFLLTMNARFIHAVDRIWQVDKERKENPDDEVLDKVMSIMIKRCRLLRRSLELLVLSIICSGMLMVSILFSTLFVFEMSELGIALLALSCMLILAAMIVLLFDVILSSKATILKVTR